MNKNIAIVLLILSALAATAQDTISEDNRWYMFLPHGNITQVIGDIDGWVGPDLTGLAIGHSILQYYGKDSTTINVYGIAMTLHFLPMEEDRQFDAIRMTPTVTLVTQVASGNPPVFSLVDSTNVLGVMRESRFTYQLYNGETHFVPSYEYYFDTPHSFSLPTDTFYVGYYFPSDRSLNYLWWFDTAAQRSHEKWMMPVRAIYEHDGNIPPPWGWYATTDNGFWGFYPNEPPSTQPRYSWAFIFPIINLRCTAPHLCFVGREGNAATVSWWQAEAGEAYQLALGTYGSNPDSGLLVTPADTFHTFTGLQPDTIYQAWVRKACRYTTAGYDTLVWSDWSQPLVFRASVGIDEVDDGGLRVTVQAGCIAVQGLAAGEQAEVYDMKGCRVALLEADGSTAPLPQGVYTLRTQQYNRHRRVVVTR